MTDNSAAKLGGTLFVASGALVIVNNYLPASGHLDKNLLNTIGVVAILLGLAVWFLIPWQRMHPRVTLVLPAIGLALIGAGNAAGGVSSYSYGSFFILIGAYIGATQPRWMTLTAAPLMIGVYVGALALRDDATSAAYWSATVVIPVAVLVGEVLANALDDLATARARSDRRSALLAVTARASRAVSALDARNVLRAVADAAVDLGYDGVSLEVLDQDHNTYRCMEARGLPAGFAGTQHSTEEGLTGEVIRTGKQTVVHDYDADPRSLDELRGQAFRVVISTPIFVRNEVVAVLNVGVRRTVEVEPSELEALELLAEQAGHALNVAGMFEHERRERRRYRRESLLDDLSGLGNRRRAEQLIDTARPGDVIGMLDIDDFKKLNDTRGHSVGDEVLASLGAFLRRSLRGGDVAARYGGEEFLVLIRSSGPGTAHTVERLRREWLATDPPVTVSIGTAVVAEGEAPRATLARADGALFEAKAAGKNRVVHADPSPVIDIRNRMQR